ncbi:MAG: Mrp/NBP35 family ATP-binding protein [Thermoleophilia bacterium]|nr:Mrp/NBP35 family ATP-binding protein [Thermoleophilia bacterium]
MADKELARQEGESEEAFAERCRLASNLSHIRHTVAVLSGKGGVGKSTVAVNLAMALALAGQKVGLLDVDIHGPSVPTMLGLEGKPAMAKDDRLIPFEVAGVKVMSMGFFLSSQDEPVIWRGPMKMKMINQFLADVDWGDLDYLIVDSPPGTGDEPLSVCQLIEHLDGAVIVTTPQRVAAVDVRKAITFCRRLKVPVLGVVENMSGFVCPECGRVTHILRSGGGKEMSDEMGVPFLGSLPLDPAIADSGDSGQAYVKDHPDSPATTIIREIADSLIRAAG